jgi:hypothetical protein
MWKNLKALFKSKWKKMLAQTIIFAIAAPIVIALFPGLFVALCHIPILGIMPFAFCLPLGIGGVFLLALFATLGYMILLGLKCVLQAGFQTLQNQCCRESDVDEFRYEKNNSLGNEENNQAEQQVKLPQQFKKISKQDSSWFLSCCRTETVEDDQDDQASSCFPFGGSKQKSS